MEWEGGDGRDGMGRRDGREGNVIEGGWSWNGEEGMGMEGNGMGMREWGGGSGLKVKRQHSPNIACRNAQGTSMHAKRIVLLLTLKTK